MPTPTSVLAAGGPRRIGHRLRNDNSGCWKRPNQNVLIHVTIIGALSCHG
jgi:hypothetical protein